MRRFFLGLVRLDGSQDGLGSAGELALDLRVFGVACGLGRDFEVGVVGQLALRQGAFDLHGLPPVENLAVHDERLMVFARDADERCFHG